MPEPPGHQRFEPHREPSFDADRAELGLSGSDFDHFFQSVEDHLSDYPWEYSEEVPDGEGIRMLRTRDAFPDIPPLYVYYRVQEQPNRIVYLGLSRAWSQDETA